VAAVTPATAEAAVTSATAKAAVTTTAAAAVTAVATTRETRPERHLRAEDWGQW
jgi:hypothetical protein